NLRKVVTKGQPKLPSHHNQQSQYPTSELSVNSKKKHGQNQYSYCKRLGYNIATCSKKAKN
ncbi:2711_t:CDS:1, partial [Dentiscutata heterogama]